MQKEPGGPADARSIGLSVEDLENELEKARYGYNKFESLWRLAQATTDCSDVIGAIRDQVKQIDYLRAQLGRTHAAIKDAVTIAVAQTSLDAYSISRDGVMFKHLVMGAGFVPLNSSDRRVLAIGMGTEVFAEFRKAIKATCPK